MEEFFSNRPCLRLYPSIQVLVIPGLSVKEKLMKKFAALFVMFAMMTMTACGPKAAPEAATDEAVAPAAEATATEEAKAEEAAPAEEAKAEEAAPVEEVKADEVKAEEAAPAENAATEEVAAQ